jgi:hypothetical protein
MRRFATVRGDILVGCGGADATFDGVEDDGKSFSSRFGFWDDTSRTYESLEDFKEVEEGEEGFISG